MSLLDSYYKEKQKQVLEWYRLWREWYQFFEDFSYEDEDVPPRPDEVYPEKAEETLEKFGYLSVFECETIKRMAHVQLAKYFKGE